MQNPVMYERTVYLSTKQIHRLRVCKPVLISRKGMLLTLANKKVKQQPVVNKEQRAKIKLRIKALKAKLVLA